MRLYSELADWFHLLTAPEDYAEEAAEIVRLAEAAGDGELRTLLELGSGGGNNASHLKARFECTLTDVSEEMLAVSRRPEPGLRPHRRRYADSPPRPHVRRRPRPRCGHVHDDGGRSQGCARNGFRAHAARRRRALPARLDARDARRETECGGHDGDGRSLRYLEWVRDPDPGDSTYEVDYVVALREADAPLRLVHDHHVEGVFSHDEWLALARRLPGSRRAASSSSSTTAPSA